MDFIKIGQLLELVIVGLLGLMMILSAYLIVLYRRQQARKFFLALSTEKYVEAGKVANTRHVKGDSVLALLADIASALEKINTRAITHLPISAYNKRLDQYLVTSRPNCFKVAEIENLWQNDKIQIRELKNHLSNLAKAERRRNTSEAERALRAIDKLVGETYKSHHRFLRLLDGTQKIQKILVDHKERLLVKEYQDSIFGYGGADLREAVQGLLARKMHGWIREECSKTILEGPDYKIERVFSVLSMFNNIDELLSWCRWALSNHAVNQDTRKKERITELQGRYLEEQVYQLHEQQRQMANQITRQQQQLNEEQRRMRAVGAMVARERMMHAGEPGFHTPWNHTHHGNHHHHH